MPCSQTPADQRTRPVRHADTAPAHPNTKARTKGYFGAQSHGLGTDCLRFARWVAPVGRKTRFRLLAKLYRVGLATHRVPAKGFCDVQYINFPLSRAFLAQWMSPSSPPELARLFRFIPFQGDTPVKCNLHDGMK
jgi:hypothetical protein